MNLKSKKELAARTLGVGKGRIVFMEIRKEEIKEMITKQDVRDLVANGAIIIKEIKGRKKVKKRKYARGKGNVRKKVNKRKREYVIMTRKLRAFTKDMLVKGKINKEESKEINKKIINRAFKSKANLKNYIEGLKK